MIRKHDLVPVILNMNDEYWLPYSLAALSGFFHKYVIYDVGSTDRSKEIIDWFHQKEKHNADFVIRYLPFVEPAVQGTFRNSMIAEADSEWYFIVDSDEVYNPDDMRKIVRHMQGHPDLQDNMRWNESQPYGIVRRIEIVDDLNHAYGLDEPLSHHRVYHNTAYWKGTHPGEEPVKAQKPSTEFWIPDVKCYHFHNTQRSTKDAEVPKRIQRRSQATYHRGMLRPFDALKEVPILRGQIEDFPRNPSLADAQEDFMAGYQ